MIPLFSSDPSTFAVISVSDSAYGVIAIGGEALGFIAIGQLAAGVVSIGQVSRGFIAIGQLAAGVFVIGQAAIGLGPSVGMLAVSPLSALGMLGFGGRFKGMLGIDTLPRRKRQGGPPVHTVDDLLNDPEPKWVLARVQPFPSGPLLHLDDPRVSARWASAEVAQKAMTSQAKGRVLIRAERDYQDQGNYRQVGPAHTFIATDAYSPAPPRAIYYGESQTPAKPLGVIVRTALFLLSLAAWLGVVGFDIVLPMLGLSL